MSNIFEAFSVSWASRPELHITSISFKIWCVIALNIRDEAVLLVCQISRRQDESSVTSVLLAICPAGYIPSEGLSFYRFSSLWESFLSRISIRCKPYVAKVQISSGFLNSPPERWWHEKRFQIAPSWVILETCRFLSVPGLLFLVDLKLQLMFPHIGSSFADLTRDLWSLPPRLA